MKCLKCKNKTIGNPFFCQTCEDKIKIFIDSLPEKPYIKIIGVISRIPLNSKNYNIGEVFLRDNNDKEISLDILFGKFINYDDGTYINANIGLPNFDKESPYDQKIIFNTLYDKISNTDCNDEDDEEEDEDDDIENDENKLLVRKEFGELFVKKYSFFEKLSRYKLIIGIRQEYNMYEGYGVGSIALGYLFKNFLGREIELTITSLK